MKIFDNLPKAAILPDLKSQTKKGILEELVLPIAELKSIKSEELVRVLLERERLGSTGIDKGIGIPHGKLKILDDHVIGFGLCRKGVDFESIDRRPTYIFFLLLTPDNSTGLHLKLLAAISGLLKNETFKERLMQAPDAEAIYTILKEEDVEIKG